MRHYQKMYSGLRLLFFAIFFFVKILAAGSVESEWRCGPCKCYKNYVNCNGLSLSTVPRDLPQDATVLYIDQNELLSVDTSFGALDKYRFTDISLTENLITSVPSNFFDVQPNLSTLKLDSNNLSIFVPPQKPHQNLRSLSLQKCGLSNFPSRICESFPNLQTLNLASNSIETIRSGDLGNCSSLVNLVLTDNKISKIEYGALKGLKSLQSFIINKNKLKFFAQNDSAFETMTKLSILDLSRNRIEALETLVFKGLDRLDTLLLHRNLLTTLPNAVFYNLHALKTLDLSYNKVSVFYNGTFYGLDKLTSLNMGYNSLVMFGDHLPLQYLTSLETLDLSHNAITRVVQIGLSRLPLKTLDISNNLISILDETAFVHLNSTTSLSLAHNQLKDLGNPPVLFTGMASLQSLDLSYNPIRKLSESTLSQLVHIRELNLDSTSLASLAQTPMLKMRNLDSFYLTSTNIYCDCNVAWLPPWIKANRFSGTVNISCAYPDAMKGYDLLTLRLESLECSDLSEEPSIVTQPRSVGALKNSNVSLTCVVKTVLNTESLRVDWRHDNNLLKVDSSGKSTTTDRRYNVSTVISSVSSGISIVTSRLSLSNLTYAAEGEYQCSAHNSFGSDVSHKARLDVNVGPFFSTAPSNMSQRVGKEIHLSCEADGDPRPDIRFNKDHNGYFPAAVERRLQYHLETYTIVNIQPSDAGVYSCVANNSVGVIVQDFFIEVWEMPDFAVPLKKRETCIAGSACILSCHSTGNPRPSARWEKDATPIVPGDRVLLVGDNSEHLLIRDASEEDAAVYSCILQNKIGRAEESMSLEIQPRREKSGLSAAMGSHFTWGIIVIIIACSIVTTSLLWVCILYYSKRKAKTYSYEPTMLLSESNGGGSFAIYPSKTGGAPETASNASNCSGVSFPRQSSMLFSSDIIGCTDSPSISAGGTVDSGGIPASITAPQLSGHNFYNTEMMMSNSEHLLSALVSARDYRAEHSGGTSCSSVSVSHIPSRYKLTPSPETSETSQSSEHNFCQIKVPSRPPYTRAEIASLLQEPLFKNQPDTPSYARHYKPTDHNYQPNVNVMDFAIVHGGGLAASGAGFDDAPPPIPSRRTLPRSHKIAMNRSSSSHQCTDSITNGFSTTGRASRPRYPLTRPSHTSEHDLRALANKLSRSNTNCSPSRTSSGALLDNPPGDKTPPRPPKTSRPDLRAAALSREVNPPSFA